MIGYNQLRNKTTQECMQIAAKFYHARDFENLERVLSFVLDSEPHNPAAVATLGAMYILQDRYGMAEMTYTYGMKCAPGDKIMMSGLGTSIRSPERAEECYTWLKMVLEQDPNNTVALTNIASMMVETCDYEGALEYAKKSLALKKDPQLAYSAIDACSLAYLGLEQFGKGFEMNRQSLGIKFRKEIIYGDEPRWEGEKDKVVIVYGEQGIGDEIFYGSVIPDAIKDCKKVIVVCDPRLEGLFKRSFKKAAVYGTRGKSAAWLDKHQWDARCAMADLSYFYRKEKKDFPGKAFLKADPVRVAQWKETFKGKTKIGIAMRGGNKFTNRSLRTIPLEKFKPLLDYGDLVSLEYTDFDYGDFPIETYPWATMSNVDYDHTAALVASLDYVVTTATSIVHLAGGLGIPCYVLRNKHYAWRYAHDMPWYNSVTIIPCDGDWDAGMKEALRLIEKEKAA